MHWGRAVSRCIGLYSYSWGLVRATELKIVCLDVTHAHKLPITPQYPTQFIRIKSLVSMYVLNWDWVALV